MQTQEIWFSAPPAVWPSQGCITDGIEGKDCAVVAYPDATHIASREVKPSRGAKVHTILDPGQTVPPLMYCAKELGFTVTYELHGQPDEVVVL